MNLKSCIIIIGVIIMKLLNCSKCGKYLGEIKKGRIKKLTKLICKECQYFDTDLPPGFSDLLGGKKW